MATVLPEEDGWETQKDPSVMEDLETLDQFMETEEELCSDLFNALREYCEEKETSNLKHSRTFHGRERRNYGGITKNRTSLLGDLLNFESENCTGAKKNKPRTFSDRPKTATEGGGFEKSAPVQTLIEAYTTDTTERAPMIPDEKSNGVMEVINRILASIKEQGKRQRAKEALKNILGGCESKNVGDLMSLLANKMFKTKKVFGSTIKEIGKMEQSEVPRVLEVATALVALPDNVVTIGIYRQNGNMALIQGLKVDVEKGHMEKLSSVKNVHLLTGLVKLFFRELKDPLISATVLARFAEFQKDDDQSNDETRKNKIKTILLEARRENRRTLQFLVLHLDEVQRHAKENMMGIENLSTMLGPCISRIDPNTADVAAALLAQNNVIKMLIEDKQCKQALHESLIV